MGIIETIGLALLIMVAYISVYALVDRICKCVENCAIAKSTGDKIDWNEVAKRLSEEKITQINDEKHT